MQCCNRIRDQYRYIPTLILKTSQRAVADTMALMLPRCAVMQHWRHCHQVFSSIVALYHKERVDKRFVCPSLTEQHFHCRSIVAVLSVSSLPVCLYKYLYTHTSIHTSGSSGNRSSKVHTACNFCFLCSDGFDQHTYASWGDPWHRLCFPLLCESRRQ